MVSQKRSTGAIQIACVVARAYAVVWLYWHMAAAERALRDERLKCSWLERQARQLQEALAEARRCDGDSVSTVPDPSHYPRDAGEAGTAGAVGR